MNLFPTLQALSQNNCLKQWFWNSTNLIFISMCISAVIKADIILLIQCYILEPVNAYPWLVTIANAWLGLWFCAMYAQPCPALLRFPRLEYWSGLPFPSPGDLPDPGIKPRLLHCRQMILRQFRHTHHALFSVELRTWGKSSWDLWSSLFVDLFPLCNSTLKTLATGFSATSQPLTCFLIWGLGPPPCSVACRCSSGIKLGQL